MKVLLMYQPSAAHHAALQAAAPQTVFVAAADEQHARREIVAADAVMGNRYLLQSLPRAERLRWVQSASVGVDYILSAKDLLAGVVLTSARGVYDDEIAEHALALALALARGIPAARDEQHRARWERRPLRTIAGMRSLILGWGGVGQAVARRLASLGAYVEAVRRSHDGVPAPDATGFVVWGRAGWRAALAQTDLLVLALPLTSETHNIVGADELSALPDGALLVNVGRGGTVDEDALLVALREGRLGGAALDVFAHEPLPPTHPVWREPALLVSPHVARSPESAPYRWEPLFVENLRRFAAGESLLNVVELQRGY